jgi:hypothetical protein
MPEESTTYDRRRPRDRGLRVGDAERDAVADLLREHHVAGRLQGDEFQDRIDRCVAAKTYADLDVLIADFPTAADERPARSRGFGSRPWPPVLVPIALILAIVALSTGHFPWFLILLVLFFVVRPMLWAFGGGRGGWGSWWCGFGLAPRRSLDV